MSLRPVTPPRACPSSETPNCLWEDLTVWNSQTLSDFERAGTQHGIPGWLRKFANEYTKEQLFSEPRILLLSALSPVRQVLVVRHDVSKDFRAELRSLLEQLHVGFIEIVPEQPTERPLPNLWARDATAILVSCSLENGDVMERAVRFPGIRGSYEGLTNTKPVDDAMELRLEKMGIQRILSLESNPSETCQDWFGNIIATPPVRTSGGRLFPYGRILTGVAGSQIMRPEVIDFFSEQGLQVPVIEVDVSFLDIKHVDEVVSFVPSRRAQEIGFQIVIPSVERAQRLLTNCIENGCGKAPVLEGQRRTPMTVEDLLDHTDTNRNKEAKRSLKKTRRQLCLELGFPDELFIEAPLLLEDPTSTGYRALNGEDPPLIPNLVNGLVVNWSYIVSDPLGPKIRGHDVCFSDFQRQFKGTGVNLHRIHGPFHELGGEAHCGTNEIRGLHYLNLFGA